MTAKLRVEILALVSLLVIQGIACGQEITLTLNNGNVHTFDAHESRRGIFEIGNKSAFASNGSISVLTWNPLSKLYFAVYSDRRSISEIAHIKTNGKTDSIIAKSTPIRLSMGVSQLSVDYLHGNVYWTDRGLQMIIMKSLLHDDKHYSKTILEGVDGLSGLVCFPEQKKLFWIQLSSRQPVIMESDLIGENANPFIQYGLVNPLDLDVDIEAERLYWIETARNTLNYVNLYGHFKRGIIPTGQFASMSGLAVFSMGRIVVYNSREVRILSYEDEVAKSQLLLRVNNTITALTVRSDSNRSLTNKCVNLKCEQFCMVKNGVTGCGCEQGSLLSNMGDRCFDDSSFLHNILFLLINEQVCYVSTRYIIGEQTEPTCIDTLKKVVDIAADISHRKVFLILAENNSRIVEYAINRDQITTIFLATDQKEITAMTLDEIERSLYWAHAGKLYRFSDEDKEITVIIPKTKRISDLDIWAKQKRLFWINADDLTIETSTLDGHYIQRFVTAIEANQLVFSINNERLYWTTGKRIVSVNMRGSDIQISNMLSGRTTLFGVYKNIIFWFTRTNGTYSSEINYSFLNDIDEVFQSGKINGTVNGIAFFDDFLQNSRTDTSRNLRNDPSANTSSERCKCPPGLGSYEVGYSCCIKTLQDNFFIFADQFSAYAYQMDMNTQNVSVIPTNGPVLHLKLDPDSNSIVFTCQSRSIMIYSIMYDSTEEYYFENVRPTHAVMNRKENLVLFVAENSTSSNLYRIDQGREIVIREKYEDVIDIVLHRKRRFLYASVGGTNSAIRMLKLATNEDIVLPFPCQVKPTAMTLDEKDDHLYLIDAAKDYILRAGLSGELLTFFYEAKGVMTIDVAIAGEFIYSLAADRRWMAKIDKKGELTDEIKLPLMVGNVQALEVFKNGIVTDAGETCTSNDSKTIYLRKVTLGLAVGFPLVIVIIILVFIIFTVRRRRYYQNNVTLQMNTTIPLVSRRRRKNREREYRTTTEEEDELQPDYVD